MWVIALATLSQANALYNILNSSVIFVYNQPVQERSIAFSTSSIYFFLARTSVCIQTTNNFVYILRMDFYQAANIVEVLKRNYIYSKYKRFFGLCLDFYSTRNKLMYSCCR